MKLQLSFAIVLLAGSIGTSYSQTDVTSATYPDLFTPAGDVTVVTPLTGLLTVNFGGTKTGPLGTYWDATANGGAAIGVNAGLIVLPLADTGAQVALKDNSLQFNLSNNPSALLGALGVGTSLNLSWSATAAFDKTGSVLNLKPNSTYRVSFDVDTGGNLLRSTLGIVPTFGVSLLDANGTAVGTSNNTTLVNILGLQLLNIAGAPANTGRAVVSFKTGATVPSGAAQIKFTGSSVLPVSLLNIGSNFAKVSNVSVTYLTPYQEWIEGHGITDPADQDPDADPDGDGRSNISEFATDSNPAVPDDNNVHVSYVDLDGDGPDGPVCIMTVPVRNGATFNSDGTTLTSTADGVTYQVQGSFDLVNWTQAVSEVTPNSAIISDTTLFPVPDNGWSYRSFRVQGQTASTPRAFLRVKIN